jgi:hypothetical protein
MRTPRDGIYLANFTQIFPEDRGTNYAVRDGQRAASLIHSFLHVPHSSAPLCRVQE